MRRSSGRRPTSIEGAGRQALAHVGDGERLGADRDPARALDAAGQDVHRRRADEGRDEARLRPAVDLRGHADLLDAAGIHDDEGVGQRHRLDLVVRDVDRGDAEGALQAFDLDAHLHAQLGVEVRERLVEQEDLGLAHDGAAHGDALALAARERPRLAVEEALDGEDARRLAHALVDLVLRRFAVAQAVGHVVVDGHVRIERVALEHHRDVPVRRLIWLTTRSEIAIVPAEIVSSPATMRRSVHPGMESQFESFLRETAVPLVWQQSGWWGSSGQAP